MRAITTYTSVTTWGDLETRRSDTVARDYAEFYKTCRLVPLELAIILRNGGETIYTQKNMVHLTKERVVGFNKVKDFNQDDLPYFVLMDDDKWSRTVSAWELTDE